MKTIAICSISSELNAGGMFTPEVCKKYIGSKWCYELKQLEDDAIQVMSGVQARNAIESGSITPDSVYVIQEEDSISGVNLISLGAKPSILMCFESPLFTPNFYHALDEMKKAFPAQMLFNGGTHRMMFPSFDNEDIIDPIPWKDRKFMSAVFSPKFGAPLQNERLDAVRHFNGRCHLFGKGWNPSREIENKIDVIKNYQFNLCLENLQMHGYMTEKIIDCFVAGTIPIYKGDPHILSTFDHNGFLGTLIPMSYFKSLDDLDKYLNTMINDERSMAYVHRGQRFLRSFEGQQYTFKGFAKKVMKIVKDQIAL